MYQLVLLVKLVKDMRLKVLRLALSVRPEIEQTQKNIIRLRIHGRQNQESLLAIGYDVMVSSSATLALLPPVS